MQVLGPRRRRLNSWGAYDRNNLARTTAGSLISDSPTGTGVELPAGRELDGNVTITAQDVETLVKQ